MRRRPLLRRALYLVEVLLSLYASRELDEIQTANFDQKIGVQTIQNALKMPAFTIAQNAGVEGVVVVGKLLEQTNLNIGYDAAEAEFVDMVKAGIVDPVKVIRTALVDAARYTEMGGVGGVGGMY